MRKFVRIGATALLAAALLAPGSIANAATGPGGAIITCTARADNPHASGHVNGTINAVGSISCTSGVAEIYVKTILSNVNTGTASSKTNDFFNVTQLSSNATKTCAEAPATFRTNVEGLVRFPAGFTPSQGTLYVSSPNTWVSCSGISRVGADEPVEITLTAVQQ